MRKPVVQAATSRGFGAVRRRYARGVENRRLNFDRQWQATDCPGPGVPHVAAISRAVVLKTWAATSA